MADIAFLLLIFFLVTTTIIEDKGILVKLPRWEDVPSSQQVPKSNVFSVLVNAQDELLIEGEPAQYKDLKTRAIEFITNPQNRADLPDNPKQAVISLINDRSTSFEAYIDVYDALKGAYNEIWRKAALERYDKTWPKLSRAEMKSIKSDYPMIISEADPKDYASLE